jgi:hypothetical protein
MRVPVPDLEVDCYAGHRGEELPRAITLFGRRFEIAEIVDRWLGPDHRYFKLRLADGRVCVVRNDLDGDGWTLQLLERPEA